MRILPVFAIFCTLLVCWLCLAPAADARQAGFDPNKEMPYRVAYGNAGDVALLLKKGANANGVNEVGWPLVSVAAARSDNQTIPILENLVSNGADLNKGGPSNQYPIIIAARTGNAELMRFLLDHNVRLDVTDTNGATALQIAVHNNERNVVEILEELRKRKEAEEREKRSPENFRRLLQDFGLNQCALHYYGYIYHSGQEKKMTKEEMKAELEAYQGKAMDAFKELQALFHIQPEIFSQVSKYMESSLNSQFNYLISNRNRKKHGIGTKKDINERCGKLIAESLGQQQAHPTPLPDSVKPDSSSSGASF